MDEKQPLFEVEHCMTEEEYWLFNKAIGWKKTRTGFIIVYGILGLIVCVCNLFLYYFTQLPKYVFMAAIFSVFLVVAVLLLEYIARRRVSKVWKSGVMRDEVNTVRFYETCLDCESANGTTHLEYSQIYELFETPTHFYIMLSMVQGIPLKKDALTEENAAFIRALAPKKEKKRKRG